MSGMPNRFVSAFEVEQFPLGEERRHQVGEPSQQVRDLPFYHLVPKDPFEQVKWRRYVRERGLYDARFRFWIQDCCKHDILFYANTFLYVFEPRPFPRFLPMNTWCDQDDVLVWMEESFGRRDCGMEKSRGVGMSYNLLTVFLKHWFFDRNCKMGLVSKDEDSVDKKDDDNSLMVKMDKMFDWHPVWMRCDEDGKSILDRAYSDHRFLNRMLNSAVYGFAATGDVATGGRMTAIGMDEFGKFKAGEDSHALKSTQHVTNCRFFPSTYKGNSNEFFKLLNPKPGQESTMLKIVADWKDNPERSRGLYTSSGGELVILDETYEYPEGYKFILDGKIRSPWYDAECRRPGATPRAIAEELDRDPRGSTSKFFTDEAIRKQSQFLVEPLFRGSLDITDIEQPRFLADKNGPLKGWMPIDASGQPAMQGPFVLACDIAAGTGGDNSSNSCIQVIDQARHEQVIEFATNMVQPAQLARTAVALAHWLSGGRGEIMVQIGFESNGPLASQFAKELRKIGYGNLFWDFVRDDAGKRRTNNLGYNNRDKGEEVLSQLQKGMIFDEIVIHSHDAIRECDEYEYENGVLVHVPSKLSDDESAKGKPHGDRAIALAIAFLMHEDKPVTYKSEEELPPPPNSLAALYAAEEAENQRSADPWQSMKDELAEAMAGGYWM